MDCETYGEGTLPGGTRRNLMEHEAYETTLSECVLQAPCLWQGACRILGDPMRKER